MFIHVLVLNNCPFEYYRTLIESPLHLSPVSPTIEPIPDVISVSLGRPIRIPCSAVGHPRPTIMWQKNNQILSQQMGYSILENGMLMINSTELSHTGRYICIAQSRAGTDVLRVDVVIEGKSKLSRS